MDGDLSDMAVQRCRHKLGYHDISDAVHCWSPLVTKTVSAIRQLCGDTDEPVLVTVDIVLRSMDPQLALQNGQVGCQLR